MIGSHLRIVRVVTDPGGVILDRNPFNIFLTVLLTIVFMCGPHLASADGGIRYVPQTAISYLSPDKVAFAPGDDNLMLVLNDFGRVDVFNVGTWSAPIKIAEIEARANAVAFIVPAGSQKKTTIVTGGQDGRLRRWTIGGQQIGPALQESVGPITSIAASADGTRVVYGAADGALRIWGLDRKDSSGPFYGHKGAVKSLAFSPNSARIASGGDDGIIRLWTKDGQQIGPPFKGHVGTVWSVAFSPTGDKIVSGGADGTLRLWALGGMEVGRPFRGHEGGVAADVLSVAFSPSGLMIASGGMDQTIRLWTLDGTEINLPFIGHTKPVNTVTFSHDGSVILSGGSDNTVRFWSLEGREMIGAFPPSGARINSIAITPDGGIIASGGGDGMIRFWSPQGQPIGKPFRGASGQVGAVGFSPDGTRIVVVGADDFVQVFTSQGSRVGINPADYIDGSNPISAAFSNDGKWIVSGDGIGNVRLWSSDGKPIRKLIANNSGTMRIAMSPKTNSFVCGQHDGTVGLWTFDGKSLSQPFVGSNSQVDSIAFSPDGRFIVAGELDGTVHLWTAAGVVVRDSFVGGNGDITTIAFSADSRKIIAGRMDGTIRIWSLEGREISKAIRDHDEFITALAFAPNGGRLFTGGSDGIIRRWDFNGEQHGDAIDQGPPAIVSAIVSPDGQNILMKSEDFSLRLFSIDGLELPKAFSGSGENVASMAYSVDGRRIVSGGVDGKLQLWTTGGQPIGRPFGITLHRLSDMVTSVAISPDGSLLAEGRILGDILIWKIGGDQDQTRLSGHVGMVSSLAFSVDGKRIASSGTDRTIRLWSLDGHEIGRPIQDQADDIEAITFTPDGKSILSTGSNSPLRLWDLRNGRSKVVTQGCSANALGFTGKKVLWLQCVDRLRMYDRGLNLRGDLFLTPPRFVAAVLGEGVYLPDELYDGAFRAVNASGGINWDLGKISRISFRRVRQRLFDEWTLQELIIERVSKVWRWMISLYQDGLPWYGKGIFWLTVVWTGALAVAVWNYLFWPHKLAEWAMPRIGKPPPPAWAWLTDVLLLYRYLGGTQRPVRAWLRRHRTGLATTTFSDRRPVLERRKFCSLSYTPTVELAKERLSRSRSLKVWISGVGGAGKSTLAFQIVHELMASACAPLPILIDEDWQGNILDHIALQLMVGARRPTSLMVQQLGSTGQICPVFDQLSERGIADASRQVKAAVDAGIFRSVIVTSRDTFAGDWRCAAALGVVVRPLTEAEVPAYIDTYAPEQHRTEVAERINLLISGRQSISPLLLRFAIEQALSGALFAPSDTYGLVQRYVEGLRAGRSELNADDFARAAEIAAIESIRETLTPREVEYEYLRGVLVSEADLQKGKFLDECYHSEIPAPKVLESLISSGLIARNVQNRRLQFTYDPVAEYLAVWRLRKLDRAGAPVSLVARVRGSEMPVARILVEFELKPGPV